MFTSQQIAGVGLTSQRARDRLVAELRNDKGITNERVLAAIGEIPRHLFVEDALASHAYQNKSLPIGLKQTISMPYTVAKMTEVLLEAGPMETVLEVGTGSGYQTAVLSKMVKQVYSVERLKPLQERAKQVLRGLRINNVRYKHSDGSWGWEENNRKYDGILVTAAPTSLPVELIGQLKPGGRLVLPMGGPGKQMLVAVYQTAEGWMQEDIEPASFVPLLSGTR